MEAVSSPPNSTRRHKKKKHRSSSTRKGAKHSKSSSSRPKGEKAKKKAKKNKEQHVLEKRAESLSAVSEHPLEDAKKSLESIKEIPLFDLKLEENFEQVKPIHYVFSQLGHTCAPDALFTLLFESEMIGPVLTALNEESFEIQLYKNDSTLGDSVKSLLLALERYHDMKELEKAAHTTGQTIVRYMSRNVAKQRGTQISSILRKGYPTCTTNATPIEAIHTYVENIVTKNRMGLFTADQKIRYILGTELEESDIEKIFACIFVIVKEGTPIGHMMGMYRKGDNWYLVNNELGSLYVAKDSERIKQLFQIIALAEDEVAFLWNSDWYFMPGTIRFFVHNS
jgi:hypothetical protein